MSDVKNIAFFTLLLYLLRVSTSNQKHNKGIESSNNNFYIPFQFSLKKTVSEHLKHKIIIKSHLVN